MHKLKIKRQGIALSEELVKGIAKGSYALGEGWLARPLI